VAAGLVAGVGVLVLDATPIGHPEVIGALTDSEPLYRALMAGAGVLTGVAMGGVAAINIGGLVSATGQMRQALWAAAAVAGIWAIAALGSAIDLGTGDGSLAGGVFTAIAWAGLAAVPAVTVFRILVTEWGRPELAALVIDLEAEGGDLRPAIARALDDLSLEVLTAPDGERLLDGDGHEVAVDELPESRALTRIQSGGNLIGALVHDAGLKRDPQRLEAVAAAAGMALQVGQLNRRIADQLVEVDASRARILIASDTARRQIERDLHDGAQQRLVAHGLRLQRARRLAMAGQEEELVALLEDATRDVREVISDIRAVSRGAQPALLAERGLAPAVDALAERAPVPVELDLAAEDLPATAERAAYFVIAEGLTNMAKHASATRASVSISRDNGDAQVTICDNGRGGAEISPGSGLAGLNDRIAAIGGRFDISSGPDGTTLEATIPCG
jgi:signal transduction histidine kinase